MKLYAMIDKSGHVCRDEDGKVVYDREDHPSLDVRRFNANRPQSAPHVVVPFVTHADYRALEERYAETVEGSSQLGLQVVELTKELAALRGKVGELVKARDHLYTVETSLASDDEQIKASDRFQMALRDMK